MTNTSASAAQHTPSSDNGSAPFFPVQRYAVRYEDAIAERTGVKCPPHVRIMVNASDYRALHAQNEALRIALRNLRVMLPSDHPERPGKERIPLSYCYVRWIDLREADAALKETP
jgi:hypothetical protein